MCKRQIGFGLDSKSAGKYVKGKVRFVKVTISLEHLKFMSYCKLQLKFTIVCLMVVGPGYKWLTTAEV